MQIRTSVSKELEKHRAIGTIGGSLTAKVELYCGNDGVLWHLEKLNDELRFILITSDTKVMPLEDAPHDAVTCDEIKGLKIRVIASTESKCERCWHQRSDVITDENHQHHGLCSRCVENIAITGEGETRLYA